MLHAIIIKVRMRIRTIGFGLSILSGWKLQILKLRDFIEKAPI
jgi:hypothetical protein